MNFYEQIFSRGRATGEGMTHFERLFAAKFGGSPPPEVREYTGPVPVTITADGTPLIDLLISGNEEHTGTPTPDSPIMPEGTGERTGQLIDYTQSESGGIDGRGNYVPANNLWRSTAYTPIDKTLQYFVSWTANTNLNAVRINYYTSDKTHISREQLDTSGTALTIPQNAAYLKWTLYVKTDFLIDLSFVHSLQLMINTGSTPLPHEPYGYKIPISSANTTTPVYLGEVETTRKIKKYVCTGKESWSVTSGQGKTRAVANFTTTMGIVPLSKVLSTHYIGVEGGEGYPNINTITVNNNGTMIIGITSEFTDVNAFKSYLAAQYAAGTPVTVWYVLAEPKTAVVNEPLMRIGDYADTVSKAQAGVNIPTNSGSTTVDVDTTVKPSEVYIKYMG